MIFIISLYFFFLISGVFEEKIFKEPIEHNGKSYIFKYPFLTIFFNNLFSLLISQTFLFILNRKNDKIKSPLGFEDKAILGIYSLVCKLSNESSLRYLDYITRIIGKSCKSASSIKNQLYSYWYLFLLQNPYFGNITKKNDKYQPTNRITSLWSWRHFQSLSNNDFNNFILFRRSIINTNYRVEAHLNLKLIITFF